MRILNPILTDQVAKGPQCDKIMIMIEPRENQNIRPDVSDQFGFLDRCSVLGQNIAQGVSRTAPPQFNPPECQAQAVCLRL